MPKPIPLHCIKNGVAVLAATGFLIGDGENVWLTTAIHTITGKLNSTTDAALYDGASLAVVESKILIPIFDGKKQRFNVIANPRHPSLIDATSVKLSPTEVESLGDYGIYPTKLIVATSVGETVTYSGFPGMSQKLIPATTSHSNVKLMDDFGIALSDTAEDGMSGAAVLSPQGLVGLMRGHKDGQGIVIRFDRIWKELFS